MYRCTKRCEYAILVHNMSEYNLPAKKSLGQHFLTNPRIIERIVGTAELRGGEVVVEIGPGTGVLTDALLKTGAHVIAIEADDRAIPLLEERFADALTQKQLELHHADVRNTEITSFVAKNTPYLVIANIPYYLSGMLLRTTLESEHQPEKLVFLVQKEVALRIAREKKESLLSLSVKAYGIPHYVATVSRGNFAPPPAVDSAILLITDISRQRFTDLDETWFFTVLHAGFSSRRKQLFGNLTALVEKERLERVFTDLTLDRTVRGEDLSVDTWCALARALS